MQSGRILPACGGPRDAFTRLWRAPGDAPRKKGGRRHHGGGSDALGPKDGPGGTTERRSRGPQMTGIVRRGGSPRPFSTLNSCRPKKLLKNFLIRKKPPRPPRKAPGGLPSLRRLDIESFRGPGPRPERSRGKRRGGRNYSPSVIERVCFHRSIWATIRPWISLGRRTCSQDCASRSRLPHRKKIVPIPTAC